MVISRQKPLKELLASLEGYGKIFIVGCGECATVCKSGGQAELDKMKSVLEGEGKKIAGMCIPETACNAAHLKTGFARNLSSLRESDAVLVMACGLGAQSVKDNNRFGQAVIPANDTIFEAVTDARGNFYEKCSLCAECILAQTGGICPVTLCPKGMLNGPCGGVDKGKCEIDRDKDCVWVLIYKELEKDKNPHKIKQVIKERDYQKTLKPHKLIAG